MGTSVGPSKINFPERVSITPQCILSPLRTVRSPKTMTEKSENFIDEERANLPEDEDNIRAELHQSGHPYGTKPYPKGLRALLITARSSTRPDNLSATQATSSEEATPREHGVNEAFTETNPISETSQPQQIHLKELITPRLVSSLDSSDRTSSSPQTTTINHPSIPIERPSMNISSRPGRPRTHKVTLSPTSIGNSRTNISCQPGCSRTATVKLSPIPIGNPSPTSINQQNRVNVVSTTILLAILASRASKARRKLDFLLLPLVSPQQVRATYSAEVIENETTPTLFFLQLVLCLGFLYIVAEAMSKAYNDHNAQILFEADHPKPTLRKRVQAFLRARNEPTRSE